MSKALSIYDELNQNRDTSNKFNAAKDANLRMSGYYCAQTYSKIGGNFSAILGQNFWAADTIFEVGRDFTVTTPKVDVCGFFATVQGNTSFTTPCDSTSWLRGVNIKPSYAFSRPFTYSMYGELDLDLAETKGRFLVVGAGEIEFIVQKPVIT